MILEEIEQAVDDINSGDPCKVRSITLDLGGGIMISLERYGDLSIEEIEERMSPSYRPFEDEIIIHNLIEDCGECQYEDETKTYYVLDEGDFPVQATLNGLILGVDDDDIYRAVFKSVTTKGNIILNKKGQELQIKEP